VLKKMLCNRKMAAIGGGPGGHKGGPDPRKIRMPPKIKAREIEEPGNQPGMPTGHEEAVQISSGRLTGYEDIETIKRRGVTVDLADGSELHITPDQLAEYGLFYPPRLIDSADNATVAHNISVWKAHLKQVARAFRKKTGRVPRPIYELYAQGGTLPMKYKHRVGGMK
jgi:hypothetical protein